MNHTEKKRACFTGHRPEKLSRDKQEIICDLEQEITCAIDEGITEFISGMARGVDLWAAKIVIDKRRSNNGLRLICAIPYKGFSSGWSAQWRDLYDEILLQSDMEYTFYDKFSYSSFMKRNRWMVDNSDVVIAVFNKTSGGTENTLKYAKKCSKEIRIIMA